jgi:hypothetical protein
MLTEKEEIEDLKKYFRIIRKCKYCSALYGLDKTHERFPFTCPSCYQKGREK